LCTCVCVRAKREKETTIPVSPSSLHHHKRTSQPKATTHKRNQSTMSSASKCSSSSSHQMRKTLTIVITGASRGLGAGIAEYYLKQGHRLGLCARTAPPPTSPLSSLMSSDNNNVYFESGVDVRDTGALRQFVANVADRFGNDTTIDLWINNAGVLQPIKPIRETDARIWQSAGLPCAIRIPGIDPLYRDHGWPAWERQPAKRPWARRL